MGQEEKKHLKLFKHQLLITIISVFAVVVAMVGGSYAIFSSTSFAEEYNVLKVGQLEISYVDRGEGLGDVLSLNGAYPVSDDVGDDGKPYRFSIMNTGTVEADFKIKIKNDEAIIAEDGCDDNLLPLKYIKYKIDNQNPEYLESKKEDDYTIFELKGLVPKSSDIYEVWVWIAEEDSNAEKTPNSVLGKHFHGKVVVESIQSGVTETVEYQIGQEVTLKDSSKWHVLENSDVNNTMVTLLSDYNLTVEGDYDSSCTGTCSPQAFDAENNRLTENNSYCTTPEFGCNFYEQNGSTVIKDSTVKTWLETTYVPKLKASLSESGGITEDLTVTLPTIEQLASAVGETFNQMLIPITTPWLASTSYWTKTPSNSGSSYVWSINSNNQNGFIQYANDKTTYGVRPVIVVNKENISK